MSLIYFPLNSTTVHSISAQTIQERRKCTKAKEQLRSYCHDIYTVILGLVTKVWYAKFEEKIPGGFSAANFEKKIYPDKDGAEEWVLKLESIAPGITQPRGLVMIKFGLIR